MNTGVNQARPDINAICNTLLLCRYKITEVTISGGEPFLFMDELKTLVNYIHDNMPELRISIMTAMPKTCYDRYSDFLDILSKIHYMGLTVQHYNENIADKIRGHSSGYDRQKFYSEIKYKEKIGLNINVCKPFLCNKHEILKAVAQYNSMGFKTIRLCEMFNKDDMYVDICKVLGISLPSPFARGCKTEYDITDILPEFEGKLYIKRSCFYRTNHQQAGIWDLLKVITRPLFRKRYFFGVIHENGQIAPYWI